jgi:hypothetical protein
MRRTTPPGRRFSSFYKNRGVYILKFPLPHGDRPMSLVGKYEEVEIGKEDEE